MLVDGNSEGSSSISARNSSLIRLTSTQFCITVFHTQSAPLDCSSFYESAKLRCENRTNPIRTVCKKPFCHGLRATRNPRVPGSDRSSEAGLPRRPFVPLAPSPLLVSLDGADTLPPYRFDKSYPPIEIIQLGPLSTRLPVALLDGPIGSSTPPSQVL